MIIREIKLKNFGKFSEKTIKFSEGINVIYGQNEAGKTTIYTAIGALLFGLDKQRGRAAKTDAYTTYQPWEHKTWYEGSLRFSVGKKDFLLERNFYHGEKSARLVCETDGEELSVEQGDLEILLGDANAELFFNTVAAGQLKMKPQDIVYSYLKNHIAGMLENGKYETDVVKVLEKLKEQKKQMEQEQKKQLRDLREQLAKCDARMELNEQETENYRNQIQSLQREKKQLELLEKQKPTGFFARLIYWLKKIFFGRKLSATRKKTEESLIRVEEKLAFYREVLSEKECFNEEILAEKEMLYRKLQKPANEQRMMAIECAMERIQELCEVKKEDVMREVLNKASELLCVMTKGKYQKLLLEESQEPMVWDGNRQLKLFQVSTGCVDQVYLSLRMALQNLFFTEEQLPLIFDDAFVYFDNQRLERLLGYLTDMNRQVLIFSCHEREMQFLEKKKVPFGKIVL